MAETSHEDSTNVLALLRERRGRPLVDRTQSVTVLRYLCREDKEDDKVCSEATVGNDTLPSLSATKSTPLWNVFGEGPLVLSEIPDSCRNPSTSDGVVLGIDEAGRGSLVGPMVYGMAFWHPSVMSRIPPDFQDSKQLTEAQREVLFEKILTTPEIGFCARILPASEISRNMLRRDPYNLNQMSHDAAIAMIRALVDAKVVIQTCYIDTVGNPESYKRLLEREFHGIEFVVESKADDKYAECSAASIVAKVIRDRSIRNWKFSEPCLSDLPTDFGSGYPSDPACKAWMNANLSNRVFGFADVVRFSWGPAKKQLDAEATRVKFLADDLNAEDSNGANADDQHKILLGQKRQQEQMSAFLSKKVKRKRLPYFESKKLQVVTSL